MFREGRGKRIGDGEGEKRARDRGKGEGKMGEEGIGEVMKGVKG